MFNKILVVCVGNICRSPMVEALLKHKVSSMNENIAVTSAGLAALVGKQADPHVQEILLGDGIDVSAHKARQLTNEMVLESDLVLVMEYGHRREIEARCPSACGKVHLVGKWTDFEIPDPYRKSKEFFKDTYQLVVQGVAQWHARLWK